MAKHFTPLQLPMRLTGIFPCALPVPLAAGLDGEAQVASPVPLMTAKHVGAVHAASPPPTTMPHAKEGSASHAAFPVPLKVRVPQSLQEVSPNPLAAIWQVSAPTQVASPMPLTTNISELAGPCPLTPANVPP